MAQHPISLAGFCFPCEVGDTPDKGLGVFARTNIPKGAIVWRHVVGEYTVFDETTFCAAIKDMSDEDVRYELTHVFGQAEFPGCLIRVHDAGVLINHDDNANVDTNNKLAPHVPDQARQTREVVAQVLLSDTYALIATRDIKSGEELTNNYLTDDTDPPFYDRLCDDYGVSEDYLGDT